MKKKRWKEKKSGTRIPDVMFIKVNSLYSKYYSWLPQISEIQRNHNQVKPSADAVTMSISVLGKSGYTGWVYNQ